MCPEQNLKVLDSSTIQAADVKNHIVTINDFFLSLGTHLTCLRKKGCGNYHLKSNHPEISLEAAPIPPKRFFGVRQKFVFEQQIRSLKQDPTLQAGSEQTVGE